MILAPPANANRVIEADWSELYALINGHVNESKFRDMTQDAVDDPSDVAVDLESDHGGLYEPEILDEALYERLERLREELQWRYVTYGDAYPFSIIERPTGWTLAPRYIGPPLTVEYSRALRRAHAAYHAALTISAYRHSIFAVTPRPADGKIGDVMQSLALPAASELVGGDCYWFGFPREDRTGMLEAVRTLAARMRVGKAQPKTPVGVAVQTKDGTVDLVAWRDLGDDLSTITVLYGQVASGLDWHGKGVKDLIDAEFFPWFTKVPRRNHYLPALFMPFAAYVEVAELTRASTASFRDHARARVQNDSESLGIVIDRFRLARLILEHETGAETRRRRSRVESIHTKVASWLSVALPGQVATSILSET